MLIVLIAISTITALSSHTVLLRGNTCETFLNRGVAVQIFLPLTVIAMAVCESPPTALEHVQTASLTTFPVLDGELLLLCQGILNESCHSNGFAGVLRAVLSS